MDRNQHLSEAEIAQYSVELKQLDEIDAYCLRVQRLLGSLFQDSLPFCYHFYDGLAHFIGVPKDIIAPMVDMARQFPFYRTDIFQKLENEFMHSSKYVDLLQVSSPGLAEMLRPFKDRAEYQVGGCYLDMNEILLGTAGVARQREQGDLTDAEIFNLKALIPFIGEGLRSAASYTRAKRFGSAFALAMENHPTALFLFSDKDELLFANLAAKRLMQNDTTYPSTVPAQEFSLIPGGLVDARLGKRRELPGVERYRFVDYQDWPELGLTRPWLALVNPQQADLGLTPREGEVLRALAEQDNQKRAAEVVGVTEATFRTHIQKICRKLDVSGSNAALTLWALSGGGHTGEA